MKRFDCHVCNNTSLDYYPRGFPTGDVLLDLMVCKCNATYVAASVQNLDQTWYRCDWSIYDDGFYEAHQALDALTTW